MTQIPGVLSATSNDPMTWYRRGEQNLRLADAIDGESGAAMTVGFARYAAGESNEWTMTYDEALVVTKGRFAVDSGGTSVVAGPGEVIYLFSGTPLVYRAVEDSELVYVSYPHWFEATSNSPYADRLDEFATENET
jgi:ethanolamine utilization protein EutQ